MISAGISVTFVCIDPPILSKWRLNLSAPSGAMDSSVMIECRLALGANLPTAIAVSCHQNEPCFPLVLRGIYNQGFQLLR